MKNESKMSWRLFNLVFFLAAIFGPTQSGFANIPAAAATCPHPGVYVTANTLTSVSFVWNSVSEATGYTLRYYRHEDRSWSEEVVTRGTSFSFLGLPPGTYDFYFATTCPDGTSNYVVIEDLLMG